MYATPIDSVRFVCRCVCCAYLNKQEQQVDSAIQPPQMTKLGRIVRGFAVFLTGSIGVFVHSRATAVGGVRQVVKPEETGILVRPADPMIP